MKFIWCDTETTGINIENAAPFQVAMIFVSSVNLNGNLIKDEYERIFYLNPYDIPGIEHSLEAEKIHGYTKNQIESFETSEEIVPIIDKFLEDCLNFRQKEKLFFCGYNIRFDFNHMVSLFNHKGKDFSKYFEEKKPDVFEQVKKAGNKRVLPYMENRKLVTVAKQLGINLENAHDAMADIKATRSVAKSLAQMGVPLL